MKWVLQKWENEVQVEGILHPTPSMNVDGSTAYVDEASSTPLDPVPPSCHLFWRGLLATSTHAHAAAQPGRGNPHCTGGVDHLSAPSLINMAISHENPGKRASMAFLVVCRVNCNDSFFFLCEAQCIESLLWLRLVIDKNITDPTRISEGREDMMSHKRNAPLRTP